MKNRIYYLILGGVSMAISTLFLFMDDWTVATYWLVWGLYALNKVND